MQFRPKFLDWTDMSDREYEDNWEYRDFQEYPPGDSPVGVITDFIKDAKEAEKAIEEDLIAEGKSPEEAHKLSGQWPLREETPMDVIREFISYNHDMQENAKKGIDA